MLQQTELHAGEPDLPSRTAHGAGAEVQLEVADGQTLLDACLRAGVWLPHACGHGLCGTCKVEVLDGEVDHGAASPFALMDFERDEGWTLACSATAQTDVCIEADIDEEPDAVVRAVRDFISERARGNSSLFSRLLK